MVLRCNKCCTTMLSFWCVIIERSLLDFRAPIHITTGSAGCQERHDHFVPNPPEWSAFRSSDYGYTRLTVFNATHLYFEQVSDDKVGTDVFFTLFSIIQILIRV